MCDAWLGTSMGCVRGVIEVMGLKEVESLKA